MRLPFVVCVGFLFLLLACTPQAPETRYYRVKHDSQLKAYNYKSRTGENWGGVGPQTPEVVPLFTQPSLSSGSHRTKVNGEWETFIDSLNGDDESKLRYLKADNTALFNSAGFPQLESLTMGGNVITLDEVAGKWGKVHTLDATEPPDIEKINYMTDPGLIHKFVVVGWREKAGETYWTNPPKGDMYWPLVSNHPVWIQLERLEEFPELPLKITVNSVLEIHTNPKMDSNSTLSKLSIGQTVTVVEYYPSGSNVWGRLKSGGWITLLWYPATNEAQYPTTWSMETLPPPPPSQ